MITSEALYYPYITATDDNFKKLSLIYRDNLHIIIPSENINTIYDENSDISEFIKPCIPQYDEIKIAIENTINSLEGYKNKFGEFAFDRKRKLREIINSGGYNVDELYDKHNTLKDKGNLGIAFIYKGKYDHELFNINFEEYCESEGLGVRIEEGLIVPEDVCCIYMKELANIMSKNRKLSKITDKVNLFEEIINSNLKEANLEDINEFKVKPIIYDLMPYAGDLDKVSIEEIINLKKTQGYKDNIPELRKLMNDYANNILDNNIQISKLNNKPELSFKDFLRETHKENFLSDIYKIYTINGVELMNNTSKMITMWNTYPYLIPIQKDDVKDNIKETVIKSTKQLITSQNTKSFLKCNECLVSIHNTVNTDEKYIESRILNFLNRRLNKHVRTYANNNR